MRLGMMEYVEDANAMPANPQRIVQVHYLFIIIINRLGIHI